MAIVGEAFVASCHEQPLARHRRDTVAGGGDGGAGASARGHEAQHLDGSAEAVREELGGEERLLKEYGRFEYFGERGLLRSEPRYATVRATKKLHAAMISQAKFEEVIGQPLSALLTETLPD